MYFICNRNEAYSFLVMNKILIIIALTVLPNLTFGQFNITTPSKEKVKTTHKFEVVIKKIDTISANPKMQTIQLNHKKNNEIISIKAYIKSLRLKRKELVTC